MISSADFIEQLPTDTTPVTPNELHIIETLFKKEHGKFVKIFDELKDAIIAGILFIVFYMLPIDVFISKTMLLPNNTYMLLFYKACAFVVIYYLIKKLYLAKLE